MAAAIAAGTSCLAGCDGSSGTDIAAVLKAATSHESQIARDVAQVSDALKAGKIPDTTMLAQREAQLAEIRSQVDAAVAKGGLNRQQSDQATAATRNFSSTSRGAVHGKSYQQRSRNIEPD